jgi:hypothetical protein
MRDFVAKTNRTEPAELRVARTELAGHLEIAQGQINQGLKLLQAASKQERRLTYTEPPYYPRPVAEALGHHAAKNGRQRLAEQAYQAANEQYPGNAHAGKRQAVMTTGGGF